MILFRISCLGFRIFGNILIDSSAALGMTRSCARNDEKLRPERREAAPGKTMGWILSKNVWEKRVFCKNFEAKSIFGRDLGRTYLEKGRIKCYNLIRVRIRLKEWLR